MTMRALASAREPRAINDWLPPAGNELVAVLGTVMEALPTPAFVADADGRTIYANDKARRALADDHVATTASVVRAIREGDHSDFAVTRVEETRGRSGRSLFLLVRREERPTTAALVRAAAERWRVSRRQADVLALVVGGHPNASIATILGIAVRTVEVHVSALFVRASVENRSALVARVLSGGSL